MSDVFLFIRHGWESIWKQKTIWLLSVSPIILQLLNIFLVKTPNNALYAPFLLIADIIFLILLCVSYVGIPFLAYSFLIGKPATFQETLSAVKKFFFRVIGCSCLGLLALSPLLFWVLVSSINNSTNSIESSNIMTLASLPLSIFAALWQFTIAGFFENDWGILESFKRAWIFSKAILVLLRYLG